MPHTSTAPASLVGMAGNGNGNGHSNGLAPRPSAAAVCGVQRSASPPAGEAHKAHALGRPPLPPAHPVPSPHSSSSSLTGKET